MNKTFIVSTGEENQRLDAFLTVKLKSFTRSQIHKLWENSQVLVQNTPVVKSYKVALGDQVVVHLKQETLKVLPQDLQLDIVWEEDDFLVVNKPQGLLMYPTPHHSAGTLANGLTYLYGSQLSTLGGEERPGIVHRLDKDTSGLVLVAKNNKVHDYFNKEMLHKRVGRYYQAVVHGQLEPREGEIDLPLGRHRNIPVIQAVVDSGRPAKTFYKVIQFFDSFTHVELELDTGRTHQIRVHLAALHHPVAGDPLYSTHPPVNQLKGQCLHAYKLEFNHPKTEERLTVTSPLPSYFTHFIRSLN